MEGSAVDDALMDLEHRSVPWGCVALWGKCLLIQEKEKMVRTFIANVMMHDTQGYEIELPIADLQQEANQGMPRYCGKCFDGSLEVIFALTYEVRIDDMWPSQEQVLR